MNIERTAHDRLRQRQAQLEQKAQWHLERAKGNLTYLRTDGVKIIKQEVKEKIADSSPVVGKVMKLFGLNKEESHTDSRKKRHPDTERSRSSYSENNRSTQGKGFSPLSRFTSAIMPTLFTVGGMKLLSTSLKGAGKIIRSGIGRFFQKKR